MYIWLVSNVLFAVLTTAFFQGTESAEADTGKVTFLQGFSIFIASLVVFKFFFSCFYLSKWNYRLFCTKEFTKFSVDDEDNWEKARKDFYKKGVGNESDSDDSAEEEEGVEGEEGVQSKQNNSKMLFEQMDDETRRKRQMGSIAPSNKSFDEK